METERKTNAKKTRKTTASRKTTHVARTNGSRKSHTSASDFLNKGRDFANDLLVEGVEKAHKLEGTVKEYSDDLTKRVKKHPLAFLAIAGGVGFIVSKIISR